MRVIHKEDRFRPDIPPKDFKLAPVAGVENNLWQGTATIHPQEGTHFGRPGSYLYRYQLRQGQNIITRWFTDPFARATDIGELGAFVTPNFIPEFKWNDDNWKVPELDRLVVYELNVEEFNSTFDGVIERLPYLQSLGVTCLELMPITSLKLDFDWGYGPLHYFAPNERWGGCQGFKRLVDACHNAGIAVILDVVYQHVDPAFPYCQVYKDAHIPSPMINGEGTFGPTINFDLEFARDYVQAANFHWLSEYHVDGFRYDEAPDFYDGPVGVKYAKLAFDTYIESLHHPRFTPSGRAEQGEYSRIIQCPEALSAPQQFLEQTYSNATWQDELLHRAEEMVQGQTVDERFMPQLLLDHALGYPERRAVQDGAGNPVDMPVAPFQYLESHDHSQLVCFTNGLPPVYIPFCDRDEYYKLQPFAIALYTCAGIPMLWQGQEFAENYNLPLSGPARVRFERNVNWEYFYDDEGAPLVRLYRNLGRLRLQHPALRGRQSFFYAEESRLNDGIVAYARLHPDQPAIVALNFSDHDQNIAVPFPETGIYREMIDNDTRPHPFDLEIVDTRAPIQIEVPSHYGSIFIKQQ